MGEDGEDTHSLEQSDNSSLSDYKTPKVRNESNMMMIKETTETYTASEE